MDEKRDRFKFFKNHMDTALILAALLGGFWNLNNRMWDMSNEIHNIDSRLTSSINDIDKRLTVVESSLDKRLTVIEAILMMQGAPLKAVSAREPSEG